MITPSQPSAGSGQYEFSEMENHTVARAAKYLRQWGVAALVVGLLVGLCTAGGLIALLYVTATAGEQRQQLDAIMLIIGLAATLIPFSLIHLITSFSYLKAGRSLLDVVDTRGNDVKLLMQSLGKMTAAFRLEAIVIVSTAFLGLIFTIGLHVLDATRGG